MTKQELEAAIIEDGELLPGCSRRAGWIEIEYSRLNTLNKAARLHLETISGPSRESLIEARIAAIFYPNGPEHPNQILPDALINEIRRIMRERDDYRNKYLMKISEPVK